MKGVWMEWKGCGNIPDGKVDVMFRDGEVIEACESSCWDWQWYTGDHVTEIVGYRQVGDKTPKVERKRPEFTFEDGFHFNFYLERRKCYSGLDNYKLFYQIAGDSVGVLDKDRISYIIKMVQEALKQSSEVCSSWEHKSLRKKLKLYVKWLQSEMSKLESSDKGE